MWLSKQSASLPEEKSAEIGNVTISSPSVAVYTDAERRNVAVYSPGGYFWRPKAGSNMLVIKTEDEPCAVGTEMTMQEDMRAGEICIKSDGGAEIFLKNNGTAVISAKGITLKGAVNVEGGLYLNGIPIV